MVFVQKGITVDGRPLFTGEVKNQPISQKSFLKENDRLVQVAPTRGNSLFAQIERLFQAVLAYFRIDYSNRSENRSLRMCTKLPGQGMSFEELKDHFSGFLEKDRAVSPDMKKALELASRERKELRSLGFGWRDRIELNHNAYLAKKREELRLMPDGESRIVVLQGKPGELIDADLFAVVTKTGPTFRVRIMGAGSVMCQLEHAGKALELAGREKVHKEALFEQVPQDVLFNDTWLRAQYALHDRPQGVLSAGLATLKPYQVAATDVESLATKTEKPTKLFWGIVSAFTTGMEREGKRIKLRAHLVSLFELFRTHRYDLRADSKAHESIRKLFTAVSADVLKAYKKGDISANDLSDITRELNVIAKSLESAEQKSIKPLNSSLPKERHKFFNVQLGGMKGPVPQFSDIEKAPESVSSAATRQADPLQELPVRGTKSISLKPATSWRDSNIETAEGRQEFLEYFHGQSIMLFKKKDRYQPDEQNYEKIHSDWWNVNPELRDKIIRFMELYVADPKSAYYDQFALEAILKMAYIITIWDREELGYPKDSWRAIPQFIEDIYGGELRSYGRRGADRKNADHMRFSAVVDPVSIQTQAELRRMPLSIDYYQKPDYDADRADQRVKSHPFREKMDALLCKLAGNSEEYPLTRDFSSFEVMQRMFRPIRNPVFLGLYRQMASSIHHPAMVTVVKGGALWGVEEQEDEEQVGLKIGWMTPEAIQTDPEGLFAYFLSEMSEVADYYAKAKNQPLKSYHAVSNSLSREDKIQLLHLLRAEDVQTEALQMMLNSRHLLRDPDARNFLDSLFFHPKIFKCMRNVMRAEFLKALPQRLEQEIAARSDKLDGLSNKDKVGEFEAIVYLIEMHEKLRGLYKTPEKSFGPQDWGVDHTHVFPKVPFANMKPALEALLTRSQITDALHGATGYVARVLLRALLAEKVVEPQELSRVVHLFVLACKGDTSTYLIDPYFERHLKNYWLHILKQEPQVFGDVNKLSNILDNIVTAQKLPLNTSAWTKVGDFFYKNGQYLVDLKTFTVSTVQGVTINGLPDAIFQSADFRSQFATLPKEGIVCAIEETKTSLIYAFKDESGVSCRVEVKGDAWTLYKKTSDDRWLRLVPAGALFVPDEMPDPESPLTALKHVYKHYTAFTTPHDLPLPPPFKKGFYIDPQNPMRGYKLDEKGNVLMTYAFRQTSSALELVSVNDTLQLNVASDFATSGLEFLARFENAENILLWSQHGKLTKVELPRYKLSFGLNAQNELVSLDPQFEGYKVVANPHPADKKHLACALVLKSDDPTKPKKLIVPSSEALTLREKVVTHSAKGFGRVLLMFKHVYEFINLMLGNKNQVNFDTILGVSNTLDEVRYSTFDLRAYTEEVCFTDEQKVAGILQLARHYLADNDFSRAYESIKRLSFTSRSLDTKTVKELLSFITHMPPEMPKTGGEAALKLKLAIELKRALKKDNAKKGYIKTLNGVILSQGKEAIQAGRSLPKELQLTNGELVEVARIAKEVEPTYYINNLKVFFVDGHQKLALGAQNELPDGLEPEIQTWKKERAPRVRKLEIEQQEKTVEPKRRLEEHELTTPIAKLERGIYRLFTPDDVKTLFSFENEVLPDVVLKKPNRALTRYEEEAIKELEQELADYKRDVESAPYALLQNGIDNFVQARLLPLRSSKDETLETLKNEIESLIHNSLDAQENLEIFSAKKSIASFDELRMAFGLNKLHEIKAQGRLPSTLDEKLLHQKMLRYFEALVSKNAIDAALSLIDKLKTTTDAEIKKELSKALYEVLTVQCNYDAAKDPRFLVFEAQRFITFKNLDAGLDQLQLLQMLVNDPYAVVQAPTAAGKTSVLGLLQALLKANGKNLIIQNVLPQLYQQTLDQYKEVLGNLFGISVFALRFNMRMALTKTEYVKDKSQEASIFKGMYEDLLATITNKGCVVTDYTSLPLLEEKFWKLSQDLLEMRLQGVPPSDVVKEHHHYLQKILVLLANKGVRNMDEFDGPNAPKQKIVLDLGVGSHLIPSFMIDTSLELYDVLLEDKELGLKDNLQQAISDEMRQSAITRAIDVMAKRLADGDQALEAGLVRYFAGEDETVLQLIESRDGKFKDKVALLQTQFTTYLSLTLNQQRNTRYSRSEDGKRTVVCRNGEKTEAKFGTIEEQINYTIQDYLQGGITVVDFDEWARELKSQEEQPQRLLQLQAVLPGVTFKTLGDLDSQKAVDEINKDLSKVKVFLSRRLGELKTSGNVISMGPQEIVDMTRATSGTSATVGAAESLHTNFRMNNRINGKIQASMVYRIIKRAKDQNVILYDPQNPSFNLTATSAIIDGAGTYGSKAPEHVAKMLIEANPALKQVGYHKTADTIGFTGEASGSLKETGFLFIQSQTRGTDIRLDSRALALLTVSALDGLRELCQKEGRLRIATQRFIMAITKYIKDILTVVDAIVHARCVDAKIDANEIFKAKVQHIPTHIRNEARLDLFALESLDGFLDLFGREGMRDLVISKPEAHYAVDGEYYATHSHLKKADMSPEDALREYLDDMKKKAERLGLEKAKAAIGSITYSPELFARMTEKVARIGTEQDLGVEVEVEQEQEQEQEVELELCLETENEKLASKTLGYYPVRRPDKKHHSVRDTIHPAYSDKLHFDDNFLPLSRRGTASLRQRSTFDDAMFRVGLIRINDDGSLTLSDYIADTDTPSTGEYYDLRTGSLVDYSAFGYFSNKVRPDTKEEFKRLIAQVKFLDGRLSGYSDEELVYLDEWLKANDYAKMKKHLLDDILRNRHQDRKDFVGSQLEKLFAQ